MIHQTTSMLINFKKWVGQASMLRIVLVSIVSTTSLIERVDAAELVWWNKDFAYGRAALDGSVRDGNRNLSTGSQSSDLASVRSSGYSLAESTTTLRFDRNSYLAFSTFANPSSTFGSASALMNTSDTPPHFKYIYFQVAPTGWGERNGQRVTVTFNAVATRTLYKSDGNSFNWISLHVNNGSWAQNTERRSGSNTYVAPTRSIQTTMGSWISLAMAGESYAIRHNSAQQEVRINISFRK